jgi:cytochrome c-type biogenesis protein CcmH
MNFWLISTMLCSAAAVGISIPLIRRFDKGNSGSIDTAIYQDQLKEVEKDLELGTINVPEAESAKVEIQRRLTASEKTFVDVRPVSNGWRNIALAASAGLVILGGANLYNIMGSPDLPSAVSQPQQAAAPAAAPQAEVVAAQPAAPAATSASNPGQVDAMIAKLTARLQANPKDAEGWRMLGWSQFNLGHYPESADAYTKALELDPNNVDYKSAYAESLVQMTQGIVTPKALALIADVLAKQPKDSRARFYDALSHEQSGDQAGALDRWLALLADTPADAGWRDDVKQRITDLAKATGRDVTAALALPSLAPATAAPQQTMGQPEKDAMVAGMIAKLAAKLEANPKDRDGWAMMIRSLTVSGDKKGADEALAKALDIFKDDKATIYGLKAVAQSAGGATAPAAAAAPAASAVPSTAAAPVISEEQKTAIQALPEGDQKTMIKGMVERLAGKLAENPNDFDGWVRLMRSYQVLGEPDKAKDALGKALTTFSADAATTDKIKAAATELGIN